MKTSSWLVVGHNGIRSVRKSKPSLNWDEIAVKVAIEIPDELFKRPVIEAKIEIKDVPNNAYDPEIVVNTVDLIEQQTGAKINFQVIPVEDANPCKAGTTSDAKERLNAPEAQPESTTTDESIFENDEAKKLREEQ